MMAAATSTSRHDMPSPLPRRSMAAIQNGPRFLIVSLVRVPSVSSARHHVTFVTFSQRTTSGALPPRQSAAPFTAMSARNLDRAVLTRRLPSIPWNRLVTEVPGYVTSLPKFIVLPSWPGNSPVPTLRTWSLSRLLSCLQAQFRRANPSPGRYALGSA